ncbi:MAG: hypothetical protein FWD38_05135 [Oscillospiraceae bacterium]|nr:hypothetical protein [Oscillospiraceae bacterium]
MKVKLLIATVDGTYAKLLSDNISEFHSDTIDVSVCNALEALGEVTLSRRYNAALIDSAFIAQIDAGKIHLPLLLWSENDAIPEASSGYERISKYQRVSSIVAAILERYAKISNNNHDPEPKQANITAVWSPAGGVGKTSIALAYALSNAPKDKMTPGKEVFYLNLEDFSSIPGYFSENGKSISSVFEMLENHDGDTEMLIKGIRCSDKGVTFLGSPDNYEDICILSNENIHELITCCARLADELIVDLSCSCDSRVKKVFEIAGKIMIVTDGTSAATTKLAQFMEQNNVYETIKEKITFVANKDAVINESKTELIISLPYLQSSNGISLCTALSECFTKEWQ